MRCVALQHLRVIKHRIFDVDFFDVNFTFR